MSSKKKSGLSSQVQQRLAEARGVKRSVDDKPKTDTSHVVDEEHGLIADRVGLMRERLKSGAYRDKSVERITDDLILNERESKARAEREKEQKALEKLQARLKSRREKSQRSNYFAVDDNAEASQEIMRRPSEKNPGFNDVFIPKGEPLFKEGQVADCIYLIDDGQIEIYSKAQDKTLAVLGANQIFGEQSILFEGRRSASAIARVDTRCLEVEGGKWRSFLDKQTRPAVLGFKALMLEQVQNNFVSMEAHKPRDDESMPQPDEIAVPELFLFDPIDPLSLPEQYREHRHLHTLFSEIAFGTEEQRQTASSSEALNKVLSSHTGLIITEGNVEFQVNGRKFFGGPGAIFGTASSMAGTDFEMLLRLPEGVEKVEFLPIDGMVCFAEIRRLKSALVRFTRAIVMRILGIKDLPVGMR